MLAEIDFRKRTIFAALYGSHSMGTASDDSDIDIRCVFIPPLSWYDAIKTWRSEIFGDFLKLFKPDDKEIALIENMVGRKIRSGETIDGIMIDFKHFVNLVCEGNGVAIDMLHVGPEFRPITTWLSELMLADKIVSITPWTKLRYYGFALFWLRWIHIFFDVYSGQKILPALPSRRDFGLPDGSVLLPVDMRKTATALTKKLESWISNPNSVPNTIKDDGVFARIVDAWYCLTAGGFRISANTLHSDEPLQEQVVQFPDFGWRELMGAAVPELGCEFIERFAREWQYLTAIDIGEWATKVFGTFKNHILMRKRWLHIVRRVRTSKEIFCEDEFRIYRSDAETLRAIKEGKWTFAQVLEEINKINSDIGAMYLSGRFPQALKPDPNDKIKFIDRIISLASQCEDLRCIQSEKV